MLKRKGGNPLSKQKLGRMVDMVIRKSRHSVVTVIVVGLVADLDALDARLRGGLFEVFGEELALFVEVVAGTLFFVNT